MRDLTSITNMMPDLQNKLAFMYYDLVRTSKHQIIVDKSEYNKAELDLMAIELLIACDTDLEEINAYLNDFLRYIHTCCLPEICSPDVVEMECQADSEGITYWVPDVIACEIPMIYNIYATVTSFSVPDLVGEFASTANNIEIILKAETGSNKQFIEVDDTFPHTLTAIYYYSNALSMYIPVNKIAEFTHTSITGFDKFTYNGALRGTTRVKLSFT